MTSVGFATVRCSHVSTCQSMTPGLRKKKFRRDLQQRESKITGRELLFTSNLESPSVISDSSRGGATSGPEGPTESSAIEFNGPPKPPPFLDPGGLLENTWKTTRQMEASTHHPIPTPRQSPPARLSVLFRLLVVEAVANAHSSWADDAVAQAQLLTPAA